MAVLGLTVERVREANGGHTSLVLRRERDVLDGIAFGRPDLAAGSRRGSSGHRRAARQPGVRRAGDAAARDPRRGDVRRATRALPRCSSGSRPPGIAADPVGRRCRGRRRMALRHDARTGNRPAARHREPSRREDPLAGCRAARRSSAPRDRPPAGRPTFAARRASSRSSPGTRATPARQPPAVQRRRRHRTSSSYRAARGEVKPIPGHVRLRQGRQHLAPADEQPQQLTKGGNDSMPSFSPRRASTSTSSALVRADGRWRFNGVVERFYRLDIPTLMRIPSGGGAPEVLDGRGRSAEWHPVDRLHPQPGRVAPASHHRDGSGPARSDRERRDARVLDLENRLIDPLLPEVVPLGHQDPEWRPDGKLIVYVRNDRDGAKGAPGPLRPTRRRPRRPGQSRARATCTRACSPDSSTSPLRRRQRSGRTS